MAFDWKKTVATVAPAIASTIGGPWAGMAVKIAADALGIEPNEEALSKAVATGDPEVFLKLKQAENNFIVRLEELGVEREKVAAGDRASARNMAEKTSLWPQVILSVLFIAGYFGILAAMFGGLVNIPDGFHEVLILLLGVMTREIPTIMQFWFGSSAGSKNKDAKAINDAVKK